MPGRLKPTDEVIGMLAAMPDRIASATQGATATQLVAPPAPGEWSAAGVIAHLRSCADVWGDAIRVIAADDPAAARPPTVPHGSAAGSAGQLSIRAINPTTWVESTDYFQLAFAPSFAAYATQRTDLIAFLSALDPDDWRREVVVTGAGRPLRYPLHQFAQRIAIHERPHLKQIVNAVAVSRSR